MDAHRIPNLASLAAELTNSTAKRLVASIEDLESADDLQATLAEAAEVRVAVLRKELERADAQAA
jgi:hypothetical protein